VPELSPDRHRLRLLERLLRLPDDRLAEAERALAALEAAREPRRAGPDGPALPRGRDWPHAPLHRISEEGTYVVSAATLDHLHHFRGPDRLDALEADLLKLTQGSGWQPEAWAAFSNHYHFIAHAQRGSTPLDKLLQELHRKTALDANERDHTPGRQVWFQYWDTRLTYQSSYLARLSYVHQNPVKHGLVPVANQYRWCSAAWFERTATPAQVQTFYGMKIDRVRIQDDFDPQ
jgi:putative transposase